MTDFGLIKVEIWRKLGDIFLRKGGKTMEISD